ncbi:invasion associated locus B family protein [Tardiphaga sp.]|jgi:invasion protein IalB|uniref:invasion associated locus B family protein n=1 Tax=Tardiphaga sp. TaxID=1926292 RepID=UPI0037DA1949
MMNRTIAVALAMLCVAGVASAQTKDAAKDAAKPAAPAPVSSAPERTTASFGDWIMRCEAIGAPAKRVCEVALILTAQGQNAPIAQVAIGKVGAAEGKPTTIVLPHNVSLTSKPRIVFAKAGDAPVEFTWQRCTPGACFASVTLSNDAAKTLGAQAEAGKIVYKTAGEQEIALPMSFRGLAQSLDALAKEP